MRLVTYRTHGSTEHTGALLADDTRVLDLQDAALRHGIGPRAELASVLALVEGGDRALELARQLIERAPTESIRERRAVHLRAPIQPPPQIRDCSCFELHLRQSFEAARRAAAARAKDPETAQRILNARNDEPVLKTFNRQPIYYKANRFATIGADDDVVWPSFSKALDYELEFGCYIARSTKDVKRDAARTHIVGYTIFNDISARDTQAAEMPGMLGPAKSKDFDTANVMGPCLVTTDEVPDPYNLTMIARVNGEEWSRGSTSTMRWKFEDLIEHISRSETLYPGEFLGSGTVGNGCGLEQSRYLSPGDVVELEVECLGVLRTRITAP